MIPYKFDIYKLSYPIGDLLLLKKVRLETDSKNQEE